MRASTATPARAVVTTSYDCRARARTRLLSTRRENPRSQGGGRRAVRRRTRTRARQPAPARDRSPARERVRIRVQRAARAEQTAREAISYPAAMFKGSASLALVSCSLLACAASPPPPPATPATSEIVVDEAVVVHADAPGVREAGLPPLPLSLPAATPAFQRGFALARPLLDAPGPAPAPDDAAAYSTWLSGEFQPWLAARQQAVQEATGALGASAQGVFAERVVGAALVGLIDARVLSQLLAVPPPPEVRGDEALVRAYQNGLHQNTAGWVEQALVSLRDCADHAARARDVAFTAWLDLCQAQMAELQRAEAAAQALAEQLERERQAEAQAAAAPQAQ
jgi:hypothetical protein